MAEIIGAIAGALAIIATLVAAVRWSWSKWRRRRASRKAPVRLTCRKVDEFHPEHGYYEGLEFEVFNESGGPVTVRGFGLVVRGFTHAAWEETVQAVHFPPYEFPLRVADRDGLDGSIHTDHIADDLYTRGLDESVQEWIPYVDVVGHGRLTCEIEPAAKMS